MSTQFIFVDTLDSKRNLNQDKNKTMFTHNLILSKLKRSSMRASAISVDRPYSDKDKWVKYTFYGKKNRVKIYDLSLFADTFKTSYFKVSFNQTKVHIFLFNTKLLIFTYSSVITFQNLI